MPLCEVDVPPGIMDRGWQCHADQDGTDRRFLQVLFLARHRTRGVYVAGAHLALVQEIAFVVLHLSCTPVSALLAWTLLHLVLCSLSFHLSL
jgi:hypothetical protein